MVEVEAAKIEQNAWCEGVCVVAWFSARRPTCTQVILTFPVHGLSIHNSTDTTRIITNRDWDFFTSVFYIISDIVCIEGSGPFGRDYVISGY